METSHFNDRKSPLKWGHSNHKRVKKQHKGVSSYYFGRDYEVILEKDDQGREVRRMRHHIFIGNELVATHEKTLVDKEKQADNTAYVHRDALGSVDTVTNEAGQTIQQQRYTPFGENLKVVESNRYRNDEIRGFTGHQNVGLTGLINMNARLYDPVIARFVQADTLIPEPGNVQSYNRYAYVINNPMKYNDPERHFWNFIIGLFLFTFSMTTDDPFLQKITAIAGTLLMGINLQAQGFTALQNGATLGFIKGTAQGGLQEGFKQGIIGGISASLTYANAETFGHGFNFSSVTSQFVTGGVIAKLRGDKFAHGAVAALGSKIGSAISSRFFGPMKSGSHTDYYGRATVSIVFGGLASKASGGSFEDGAYQALFVHLFNDVALHVDPRRAGGNGHTSLYFQDKDGQWYKYDQGAVGEPSQLDLLLGRSARGVVHIQLVQGPPKGAYIIKTSPIQDGSITSSAFESQLEHASGNSYNLYSNNCTDACVDVLANSGINIYNPATTVKPNSWFKELKEQK